MTMMVIMLPVLMGFMSLAIDATYYWFRGVQIQRAADAAALAGVTRMPKYSEAVTQGNEIAKRNGFVDGEADVVVTPARVPKNNKRFKVTITDNNVGIFFGRLFSSSWKITKTSTAEYISNIPLGSKENAIGTGYLRGMGTPQNFWLAVSGPCSPKESGDQFLSRWDGNTVNQGDPSVVVPNTPEVAAVTLANKNRAYSMICHVDPASSTAEPVTQMRNKINAKNASYPGLFPAVVRNLDYDVGKTGYDYIVDVPCYSSTGVPTPPPCDSTALPGDLVIQVYDPVFNPDSIQRYGQRVELTTGRTDTTGFTNELDDPRLKPDKFGVPRPDLIGCASFDLAKCKPAEAVGDDGNPGPWDVRVDTDIRLYPPDDSPLDYSNDVGMDLSTNRTNVVSTASATTGVTADEVTRNNVLRFGSCLKWTDGWTSITPDPAPRYFYSIPPAAPVPANDSAQPGTPLAGAADVDTWFGATGLPTALAAVSPTLPPAECDKYSSKWVTVKRIHAMTTTNRRGRYRLNIRTVDAPNSFGSNGFGIRAFFKPAVIEPTVPPSTPLDETYPACLDADNPSCASPAQTASVAGDSTMSVFASVPKVSRFYLAQLSPAKLFRNKVVVVSLWDPGEGAKTLQILRPELDMTLDCAAPDRDIIVPAPVLPALTPQYCLQSFQWTVGRTGLSKFSTTDPLEGLGNSVEFQDRCLDSGVATTNVLAVAQLDGSGIPDDTTVNGTQIAGCSDLQWAEIMRSRGFKSKLSERKFNDRLVSVAIKVPDDYGCARNTGVVVPPVTGTFVPCNDLEDSGAGLPEGGWWKIKYTPKTDPVTGNPQLITDRTTWSVGLRGDPVHLVPNGS
jgi:Putative Flp pilus-assembly TadE/G-like